MVNRKIALGVFACIFVLDFLVVLIKQDDLGLFSGLFLLYLVPIVGVAIASGFFWRGITKRHLVYSLLLALLVSSVFWVMTSTLDMEVLVSNSREFLEESNVSIESVEISSPSFSTLLQSVLVSYVFSLFAMFIAGKSPQEAD